MNENSKRKQFEFGLKVGKKYLESQVSRNQTVNDWQNKRGRMRLETSAGKLCKLCKQGTSKEVSGRWGEGWSTPRRHTAGN